MKTTNFQDKAVASAESESQLRLNLKILIFYWTEKKDSQVELCNQLDVHPICRDREVSRGSAAALSQVNGKRSQRYRPELQICITAPLFAPLLWFLFVSGTNMSDRRKQM